MASELRTAIRILRMYDAAVTKRFYLEYRGRTLEGEDGQGDRPTYMKVSRDGMRPHLSSHHDDGTPGTEVLVVISDVAALQAELATRNYAFLNPGLEPGPGGAGLQLELIDPASNRLRFYQPPAAP